MWVCVVFAAMLSRYASLHTRQWRRGVWEFPGEHRDPGGWDSNRQLRTHQAQHEQHVSYSHERVCWSECVAYDTPDIPPWQPHYFQYFYTTAVVSVGALQSWRSTGLWTWFGCVYDSLVIFSITWDFWKKELDLSVNCVFFQQLQQLVSGFRISGIQPKHLWHHLSHTGARFPGHAWRHRGGRLLSVMCGLDEEQNDQTWHKTLWSQRTMWLFPLMSVDVFIVTRHVRWMTGGKI